MLSKNKIKYIQALLHKKVREETGLFVAEGEKLITELIKANFRFETLVYTNNSSLNFQTLQCEKIETTQENIKKISSLKTSPSAIAICHQAIYKTDLPLNHDNLILVLDQIQDPGNLGTIIRLASWFGIEYIVCSPDTVDCYNPKVVQATMGAIAHVKVLYTDLSLFLNESILKGRTIYGTFLDGDNIYGSELKENGIIILGNEGNGISKEIEKIVTNRLFIPSYQSSARNVESLNVSIAAAIVCSEFRRKKN